MANVREQAVVLALVNATIGPWHRTASMIEELGSAEKLLQRGWTGFESFNVSAAEQLAQRVPADAVAAHEQQIRELAARGITTLTVVDPEYPANLRAIYDLPPMLFIKGRLLAADANAVAVIGTRTPSVAGAREARRWAAELARRGITVLSGLARGIDTAAHVGALEAGGRTIAVMGTGIERLYPADNAELARRIEAQGALVSQFWPDAPPRPPHFLLRNVVMSGLALGTLVIEASERSGARMQARAALEHTKRVFLLPSLVRAQAWAKRCATRSGALVVSSPDEIVRVVEQLVRAPEQLTLA